MLVSEAPTSTLGLVFGAGVKKDGTPTPMLADRIYAGVALYKAGKVQKLMMTGDDGRMWSNEVDSMRSVAVQLGVPAENIIVDRHGYRTYESCYREAKVYGVTSTIVISQAFHLSRIMYLCDNFGISSIGVASDFGNYGWDEYWMEVREAGARLKAWWQVNFTKPLPEEPSLKD
jgi:vancomycin permeability regulator SanA